jgi:hypothetical protein
MELTVLRNIGYIEEQSRLLGRGACRLLTYLTRELIENAESKYAKFTGIVITYSQKPNFPYG